MFGGLGLCDAESDVSEQFAVEAVLDLPRGDKLAVDARKRRGVDAEDHRDGRFVDGDDRKRFGVVDSRDRFADLDIVKPGQCDDLARACLVLGSAFEPLENKKLLDAGLLDRAVAAGDSDLLIFGDLARKDAADREAADERVVVDIGDEQLE